VLPQIKVFLWRVGVSALPTRANIGRWVPHFTMSYAICGAVEESNTHILLNYLMATSIWEASKFDRKLWEEAFLSVLECMWQVKEVLDGDELGEFVAVLWECWNSCNQFLFGNKRPNLTHIGKRARAFVHGYREVRLGPTVIREEVASGGWRPPESVVLKLNVDAGNLGEGRYGWGFVLRDHWET